MAAKKRKSRSKKKQSPSIFFQLILITFLVCVVSLGLYLFFSNSPDKIRQPIYEEIYSITNDLSDGIRKIDAAVYDSLYNNGIPKNNISFSNVQPKHQNGHVWDFTEIQISCPNVKSAFNLQQAVIRHLVALGDEISFRNEKASDGRIICHIFTQDLYTHKIVFSFDTPRPPKKEIRPRIAIIIDDFGYDSKIATSFIKLNFPFTFSELPSAPFTRSIVKEAGEHGIEVMLHLPMEPKSYPSVDPGPGALFLRMDEHEIIKILTRDLREIPEALGVNNHMGSCFTESPDKMQIVLNALKKRKLFYIDSVTTGGTVGYKLAKRIGLSSAKRNVFLDHEISCNAITMQMERLLSIARHTGFAIGIGHPHKETLEIIKKYCPKIKMEFHVVPVSELVS